MKSLKKNIHRVVFEAETPLGRAFDIGVIVAICLSTFVVILESIEEVRNSIGPMLINAEWGFTILSTIEYFLRIFAVKRPLSYVLSFYGMVDLLAILPTYMGLYLTGVESLMVIRAFRLLRIFRVFKLGRYVREAGVLVAALKASQAKITVFLLGVSGIVVLLGAAMHVIENEREGFSNILEGMYWAVVTMTTVGYGDVVPVTPLGRFIASIIMIFGYGVIAVPTGIVSAEIVNAAKHHHNTFTCRSCLREGHSPDAVFCRYCGQKL